VPRNDENRGSFLLRNDDTQGDCFVPRNDGKGPTVTHPSNEGKSIDSSLEKTPGTRSLLFSRNMKGVFVAIF